jgi:hypothetical protein
MERGFGAGNVEGDLLEMANSVKHWRRGDTVMVRYPIEERMVKAYQVARSDTVVHVVGWPHVVIEDTDERVALYMPEGTTLWRWNVEADEPRPPRITLGDSVRLFFPGKRFEVSLFYDAGSGPGMAARYYFPGVNERFLGWKVDITSLFSRTKLGLDMIDEVLDICVRPDRSYDWRDEDEMAHLVKLGVYTAAEAKELYAVGREVIAMVEAHQPPFNGEWQTWRPAPDLAVGEIPQGWQYLPVEPPYKAWSGPLT